MGLAVNDDRLCQKVGATVIGLFLAVVAFLFIAGDWHWRSGFTIKVYFAHPGSLREGADVHAGGRVIGKVQSISLVPKSVADADPKHLLHGTGGVMVTVRIEKRFRERVAKNGEFFMNSKSFLAKGYLEIGPPLEGKPWTGVIEAGDEVRGADPPQLDKVMQRSYDNLMVSARFLEDVRPEWDRFRAELTRLQATLRELAPGPVSTAKLMLSMRAAFDEAKAIRDKLRATGVTIEDLKSLRTRFSVTMTNIERSVAEVRGEIRVLTGEVTRLRARLPKGLEARFRQALAKTDQSLAKLRNIANTANELAAMIRRGEGNIGALMNDPEFSDDAKKLGKMLKSQPWRLVGRPLTK